MIYAARVLTCLDVHYEPMRARTALVGFRDWSDARPVVEQVTESTEPPAPYEPGQFYKRELPHLVVALERFGATHTTDLVIVDGHVWLDGKQPGLGAHLFVALGEKLPVVGVGKTSFHDAAVLPITRGQSAKPLYVSAVGIDPARAAELVRAMHGAHRLPTLLQRADHLARGLAAPIVISVGS